MTVAPTQTGLCIRTGSTPGSTTPRRVDTPVPAIIDRSSASRATETSAAADVRLVVKRVPGDRYRPMAPVVDQRLEGGRPRVRSTQSPRPFRRLDGSHIAAGNSYAFRHGES